MPIQSVAVIGAGDAGMELARLCSHAGFATTLEDILPARLRKAAGRLASAPECSALRYVNSVEDAVRTADLVLDTVPDELESKLEVWALLDRMAPPRTLFVTVTEHLSVADLASCTYRPGQCFGIRLGGLSGEGLLRARLSCGPSCEAETLGRVERFCRALGAEVTSAVDATALP